MGLFTLRRDTSASEDRRPAWRFAEDPITSSAFVSCVCGAVLRQCLAICVYLIHIIGCQLFFVYGTLGFEIFLSFAASCVGRVQEGIGGTEARPDTRRSADSTQNLAVAALRVLTSLGLRREAEGT